MTFRAKDTLDVNELLMIDKKAFKVEYIHDEQVMIPVVIKGFEYQVECKVAVLVRL